MHVCCDRFIVLGQHFEDPPERPPQPDCWHVPQLSAQHTIPLRFGTPALHSFCAVGVVVGGGAGGAAVVGGDGEALAASAFPGKDAPIRSLSNFFAFGCRQQSHSSHASDARGQEEGFERPKH